MEILDGFIGYLFDYDAWYHGPGPLLCWLLVLVPGVVVGYNMPDDARLPERVAAGFLWWLVLPLMGTLGLLPLVRRYVRAAQRGLADDGPTNGQAKINGRS